MKRRAMKLTACLLAAGMTVSAADSVAFAAKGSSLAGLGAERNEETELQTETAVQSVDGQAAESETQEETAQQTEAETEVATETVAQTVEETQEETIAETEASLDKPVEFTFVSGESGTMSAGAMLMHVVNHASYHRGWVIQMYFDIPAMPPMTDLPIFLRETDPSFNAIQAPAPAAAPTCVGRFASATNVLPDRYR